MTNFRYLLSATFLSIGLIAAQPVLAKVTIEKNATKNIIVKHSALFPEDIRFDKKSDSFIVGSIRDGAVYKINGRGDTSLLIKDDRLISVLGIQVDRENDRIYVANSDLGIAKRHYDKGTKKLAALGIYKLSTGENLQFVYLNELFPHDMHLANGLAIDTEGNAYLTDSFSPTIYKITPEGEASIFLTNTQFEGEGINLNGATVINNEFLLVAKKSEGILFKIPLNDPQNFSTVAIKEKMIGADGVVYIDDNTIAIVANIAVGISTNAAFIITTDDNWKTATVENTVKLGDVYPTNGVVKNDKLYVMHSNLNELVQAPKNKKGTLSNAATIRYIGTITKD